MANRSGISRLPIPANLRRLIQLHRALRESGYPGVLELSTEELSDLEQSIFVELSNEPIRTRTATPQRMPQPTLRVVPGGPTG